MAHILEQRLFANGNGGAGRSGRAGGAGGSSALLPCWQAPAARCCPTALQICCRLSSLQLLPRQASWRGGKSWRQLPPRQLLPHC